MKNYTESELVKMTRPQLIDITIEIAKMTGVRALDVAPKGADKELLIDSILEFQEPKGGAR